jgi:hypothetical protein
VGGIVSEGTVEALSIGIIGVGGPAHRALWLGDPDGYLVVLASPDGESRWPEPRVPPP